MIDETVSAAPAHDDETAVRRQRYEAIRALDPKAKIARMEALISSGYPLRRICVATGLSEDDVKSLIGNGTITGRTWGRADEEQLKAITAISSWLDTEKVDQGDAETPTYRYIYNVIQVAHLKGHLAAITGGYGIGKSRAAAAYAAENPRRHNSPGAVRIQFDTTCGKPVAALQRILDAIVPNSGNAYRNGSLMNAIGANLGKGDCLILDECNYLGEACNVARDIHENYGIPIVMIGNPEFSSTVWGKSRGKNADFSALASRTPPLTIQGNTEDDVDSWLEWRGLSGNAHLRRACVAIALRGGAVGGLRTLALIVDRCADYFPDTPLSAELVLEYARQIGRGVD